MRTRLPFLTTMATLCLALGTIPSRSAAAEFAAARSYPVGTSPSGVATGDFNGDGKIDVAVVNSGSNDVSLLLGNGNGTFQPAKNFNVGNSMDSILAADFNGDGKLDLAIFLQGNSSNSANGEVRILLGNGDGTFQPPVATALTMAATLLNAADLNGNQKADLVLSNVDPNTQTITLEILVGNGDGTFQAPKQIPVSGLNSAVFTIADFNKDGKSDLVVGISGGAQVLLGKGDGTFLPGGTIAVAGGVPANSILAADFNADGNLDLLVNASRVVCVKPPNNPFVPCSWITQGSIGLFPGLGDGTFGSEVSGAPICMALGDFNGDARIDCVADNSVGIMLGRGDGTFSPAFAAASQGAVASTHDLNGDKLDDLVMLDPSNNAILVLINNSPASGADLGIVSAGALGRTGQGFNFTYSADVLNEGPGGATNVTFTDTLPSNVTFVSAASTAGSCIQSNLVVSCNIGSLADAADAQITIVVTPTATGTITNTMHVSATESDLAPANNSATQVSTVVPVYTLTITKSGNGSGTVTGFFSTETGLFSHFSCGTTCSATFLQGTVVHLGDMPDSGSFFQNWGGACSGTTTASCPVTMNSDQPVTADFVLGVSLNVAFAGGGNGTVTSFDGGINCMGTIGTCSLLYAPGTSVSLTAAASGLSTFASWSGACSGTDPNKCNVTMSAAESVTARFNPPPDFAMSPASISLAAAMGGQVTDVISITDQGGFSAAIQLSCIVVGSTPGASCSLSPNNIPAGANAPTSTLAVSVPAQAAMELLVLPRPGNVYPTALPLAMLACLFVLSFDKKRRRLCVCSALLVVAGFLPSACGGGGNVTKPPQQQTYTVTVSATSGALQHSVTVTVITK